MLAYIGCFNEWQIKLVQTVVIALTLERKCEVLAFNITEKTIFILISFAFLFHSFETYVMFVCQMSSCQSQCARLCAADHREIIAPVGQ